ncbi:MAG: sensor histidine kinase [Streptosporangiaceae bacterium]
MRAAGCQALDELRDLVGILRTSPPDDEGLPASGLSALIAESTAVVTPTELAEHGDPGLASPVVGRTVHRIVREALTNVRKDAPGARVLVQVRYNDSEVRLTVTNTPSAGRQVSDLATTGSGLGIASLRHRVDVAHGTLRASRTEDGGFCLEAIMPAYVPTADPAA